MSRLRNMVDNRTGDKGNTAKGLMIYSPFGNKIGGAAGQGVGEAGTTQYYDLGTRMVTGDGRVYRYAKAGATLIVGQGAHSYESDNYIRYAVIPAAVVAGSSTISLTVNAHDGSRVTHDGTLILNELVGGYILVFDKTATNHVVIRMVTANTAVASGGGTTVCTVDEPYPLDLVISTDAAAAMASPYLDVRSLTSDDGERTPMVGVPTVPATVGQYFWLQTWGVCWIASAADVGTGNNVHETFFGGNGALVLHGHGANLQNAGFMISSRARDGITQGETFIILKLRT